MVYIGIHIDGVGAAEDQGVDDAPVDVAGQNDLASPLADGEHHALYCGSGAAHHQKGVGSAKGLGCQLFGFPDDGYRMTEVVQWFH